MKRHSIAPAYRLQCAGKCILRKRRLPPLVDIDKARDEWRELHGGIEPLTTAELRARAVGAGGDA